MEALELLLGLGVFLAILAYILNSKKEEQKGKDNSKLKSAPEGHVQEYKRTCNECGKVWHSLISREKEIHKDVKSNACIQACTACGGNLDAATQSKRSVESQTDLLDKLRKCPECGSRNYTEKVITYEKK